MYRKYLTPILSLAGALFAVYTVIVSARPVIPAQPVADPASTSFVRRISGAGLVEAATRNIAIGSHLAGVVAVVHVRPGDEVAAGTPLFTLDDRQLKAELAAREAELALARARLARLEQAPRPEEIPAVRAQVAEAQANLDDARRRLASAESAAAAGDSRAVSREDLTGRRAAAQAAEARLNRAKADLKLLEAGTWKPDLEIAKNEVRQAEARAGQVRVDLDRLSARAPVDGTVLQVNVRPGEFAPSGVTAEPLALMGATNTLRVRVDVDENDAWRFDPGAKATASVRGNSELRTGLTYEYVEPYVIPKRSLTGAAAERVDTRVLQVVYSFKRESLPVYAGQQVDVFIEDQGPPAGNGAKPKAGG